MQKYNILVFPCGTETANEIINSLKNHKYFKIMLASSEEGTYCDFRNTHIHKLPYINEERFLYELNNLISRHRINFIIPAHDDVAYGLSKLESERKLQAQVIGQSYKVNKIVRFKDKTYEFFKDKLPIPKLFNEEDITFPIFVKPKVGQGSQNTYLIKDKTMFECFKHEHNIDEFVIMEYLPGKEFTIDCFSDNGELLYFGARIRERTFKGISIKSKFIDDPKLNRLFEKLATTISKTLKMHGIWFFQTKEDGKGNLKLLEIGARVSGTMMLNRVRGVNFVELAIYQKLGHKVNVIFNNVSVSLAKSLVPVYKLDIDYDNLYIDFDDTLCLEGKYINPDLIKLIFQAKNKKKKVFLLTKNKNLNLVRFLNTFGIFAIFDDIIHINEDDNKVKYIKPNSILIDDSFSERRQAIESGIYAFGIDNFYALMEV